MAEVLVDTDIFVARLLAPFREIGLNRDVAARAGRIRRESGVRLTDALIAATALEHRLAMASRNERDFSPIRGIRIRALR